MKEELRQKAERRAEIYSEAFVAKGVAKESYIKGYIAGAKENGIQWHDLRKNPKDLPEEKKDVLVLYSFNEVGIKHLEWNKEWWGNGTYIEFKGVIKWAEIPL